MMVGGGLEFGQFKSLCDCRSAGAGGATFADDDVLFPYASAFAPSSIASPMSSRLFPIAEGGGAIAEAPEQEGAAGSILVIPRATTATMSRGREGLGGGGLP